MSYCIPEKIISKYDIVEWVRNNLKKKRRNKMTKRDAHVRLKIVFDMFATKEKKKKKKLFLYWSTKCNDRDLIQC